ncbi:hypothetical protein GOP47_0000418 [Adiantum capillus-veneris]|uniref:Hexosyltransferase n=1 Tax=Adiantum capillus-veneris TaxID=13818 RepID=A0A9D4ZQI9_ADICA|nr:hypothetical protein GOP47_0000418 [Adiantum capillus-veneris]
MRGRKWPLVMFLLLISAAFTYFMNAPETLWHGVQSPDQLNPRHKAELSWSHLNQVELETHALSDLKEGDAEEMEVEEAGPHIAAIATCFLIV